MIYQIWLIPCFQLVFNPTPTPHTHTFCVYLTLNPILNSTICTENVKQVHRFHLGLLKG